MSGFDRHRRDEFDEPGMVSAVTNIFHTLDQHDKRKRRKRSGFGFWVLASVLAVFVGVIWYSYPKEKDVQRDMAVPIIRADAEAIKSAPDDPGGMDIPFQESTIYDAIQYKHASQSGRVENLLDENERPLDREQVFAGLRNEITPQNLELLTAKESSDVNNTAPIIHRERIDGRAEIIQDEVPVITDPVKTETPKIIASGAPVPSSKPDAADKLNGIEAAAGNPTRKITPAQNTSYYVQLGSLKSEAKANDAWKSLQRRYPAALAALDYRVQRADIKDRGTFYRLQAGPLEETKARSICNDIQKKSPGGCLVIK